MEDYKYVCVIGKIIRGIRIPNFLVECLMNEDVSSVAARIAMRVEGYDYFGSSLEYQGEDTIGLGTIVDTYTNQSREEAIFRFQEAYTSLQNVSYFVSACTTPVYAPFTEHLPVRVCVNASDYTHSHTESEAWDDRMSEIGILWDTLCDPIQLGDDEIL